MECMECSQQRYQNLMEGEITNIVLGLFISAFKNGEDGF